jgi:hypothetical protein
MGKASGMYKNGRYTEQAVAERRFVRDMLRSWRRRFRKQLSSWDLMKRAHSEPDRIR